VNGGGDKIYDGFDNRYVIRIQEADNRYGSAMRLRDCRLPEFEMNKE